MTTQSCGHLHRLQALSPLVPPGPDTISRRMSSSLHSKTQTKRGFDLAEEISNLQCNAYPAWRSSSHNWKICAVILHRSKLPLFMGNLRCRFRVRLFGPSHLTQILKLTRPICAVHTCLAKGTRPVCSGSFTAPPRTDYQQRSTPISSPSIQGTRRSPGVVAFAYFV